MSALSVPVGFRGALMRYQDWAIGLVHAPASAFLDPDFVPDIRWLPVTPPGRFAADPFLVSRPEGMFVLYEDFSYATGRGHLAALRLHHDTTVEPCGPVLSNGGHLSYPCAFDADGEQFCVPEASDTGEVALYRIGALPGRLERVATILPGVAAVDPTVFEYGGRWWLACGDLRHGSNDALFLYHADHPEGPWHPHAANPVKTDRASSRPGGTPFVHDGALYRPAQDCIGSYGGRVALNRVTALTPEVFAEETVRWIEPDPAGPRPDGLHTLSSTGSLTVVDGKRLRFSAGAIMTALRRRIGLPAHAAVPEALIAPCLVARPE